jgi:hypothetical protein
MVIFNLPPERPFEHYGNEKIDPFSVKRFSYSSKAWDKIHDVRSVDNDGGVPHGIAVKENSNIRKDNHRLELAWLRPGNSLGGCLSDDLGVGRRGDCSISEDALALPKRSKKARAVTRDDKVGVERKSCNYLTGHRDVATLNKCIGLVIVKVRIGKSPVNPPRNDGGGNLVYDGLREGDGMLAGTLPDPPLEAPGLYDLRLRGYSQCRLKLTRLPADKNIY